MPDGAAEMKARLRDDLREALRARDAARVRLIRGLVAALDDAEAVPPGDRHARYRVHAFGDRSAEVERLRLSAEDVREVLAREAASRRTAAAELRALDQTVRAAEVEAEAEGAERYAASVG